MKPANVIIGQIHAAVPVLAAHRENEQVLLLADDQFVAVNVCGSEQFGHDLPLVRCVTVNARAQIGRHKEVAG